MVKGPILVKAKEIGESEDGYYLEFELTPSQKSQFLADILYAHQENGTLTIERSKQPPSSESLIKMKFLETLIREHPKMPKKLKDSFFNTILALSKDVTE